MDSYPHTPDITDAAAGGLNNIGQQIAYNPDSIWHPPVRNNSVWRLIRIPCRASHNRIAPIPQNHRCQIDVIASLRYRQGSPYSPRFLTREPVLPGRCNLRCFFYSCWLKSCRISHLVSGGEIRTRMASGFYAPIWATLPQSRTPLFGLLCVKI